MSTTLIEVRPAKASDASAVASTHDEAWRSAYQGIIPGAELEKLINRRGPQWWDSAIRKGSRVSVLVFGDKIAGYANYGRNRARSLHFEGEIYELYLRPEFQGLGFGRRLFTSARRDLLHSGLKSMVIWALSDNDPATQFYRALGEVLVANPRAIVPGAVMSVRPVGVLLMEDEAGGDEKIIAVPSSKLTKRYEKVRTYSDLPDITLQQIQHFFEHYKDLEPGKWVKVLRWGGPEDAHNLIAEGIARAKAK